MVEEECRSEKESVLFSVDFIEAKLADLTYYTDDEPIAFVYFITDGLSVKIGVAQNLDERISDLQTGNPRKLKYIALIPFLSKGRAIQAETRLHGLFSSYRQEGEWFNILTQVSSGVVSLSKFFSPAYYLKPEKGEI